MELPIVSVADEILRKNTGTVDRPFWTRRGLIRRIRFLGVLIFRYKSTGEFPEPESKK
jgi:hypothetical protein